MNPFLIAVKTAIGVQENSPANDSPEKALTCSSHTSMSTTTRAISPTASKTPARAGHNVLAVDAHTPPAERKVTRAWTAGWWVSWPDDIASAAAIVGREP